jgi:hypothetical protein
VTFPPVPPDVMRSAQIFTGLVMAAFLAIGFLPGHRARLRAALLVIYLVGIVAFCLYVFGSANAATSA